MSAVTKPIMLDETGKQIHTDLSSLADLHTDLANLADLHTDLQAIVNAITGAMNPIKSMLVTKETDENGIFELDSSHVVPVCISDVAIGTTPAEAKYHFVSGIDGVASIQLTDRNGDTTDFAEKVITLTLYYISV